MREESLQEYKKGRMYVILLSIIALVFFVGYAARKMFPTIDDATLVSLDTLKVAFSERVQMVHTYWINNGKQSRQFLDVTNDGLQKIRVSYIVNKNGWPIDSKFVNGMKNTGNQPCERLWEGVLLKNVFQEGGLIKVDIKRNSHVCRYRIGNDVLEYSFVDGSIKLFDLETTQ